MILFFEKLPKNEKKNPHDLAKLAYQWSPPPWPHHKSFFIKNNTSSKALEYKRKLEFYYIQMSVNNIYFLFLSTSFFLSLIFIFFKFFWGGVHIT